MNSQFETFDRTVRAGGGGFILSAKSDESELSANSDESEKYKRSDFNKKKSSASALHAYANSNTG